MLDHANCFDMIGFLAELGMCLAKQARGEVDEGGFEIFLVYDLLRDADVLVEQREPESARVLSPENPFRKEIIRRIGAATRAIDDIERDTGFDTELCQRGQCFPAGPDVNRKKRLVHCLYGISGTDVTAAYDFLSERMKKRHRALNIVFASTAHDG
jgi:hypothetical protein